MPRKRDRYDELAIRLVNGGGPVKDAIVEQNDAALQESLAREMRAHFLSQDTKSALAHLKLVKEDRACQHAIERSMKNESCLQFRKRMGYGGGKCWNCSIVESVNHLKKLLGA